MVFTGNNYINRIEVIKKVNRLFLKYAVLYNFTYMAIGALTPLIGQYLDELGFSGAQIGTVTATGTAVAIFASTFWGKVYSCSRRKYGVLMLLCTAAAAVCGVFSNMETYLLCAVVFGCMYFFQAPIMSLTDAFTVESIAGRGGFGQLRAWGAVGFALGVFLAGNLAEKTDVSVIFIFYIGSYLIAAFVVAAIKLQRRRERDAALKNLSDIKDGRPKRSAGYRDVFRNRRLMQLILCAFFMGGTNVANNTYFSFLYIEGGGTLAGVGIAMLLMVGSEVPFMAWCEKLSRRLTMERLVLISMCISSGRFILMGIGLPWWMLIIIAASQGAVNGILLIEFVRYSSKLAAAGTESLAISTYYILGSNLSTIVCQVVGGRILDFAGAWAVYLFFGIFNLAGILLYIKFRLYRQST